MVYTSGGGGGPYISHQYQDGRDDEWEEWRAPDPGRLNRKYNVWVLISKQYKLSYTLVRKIAFTARAVILVSSGVIRPHGKSREERQNPAESYPHLYLPATGSVSVSQGELDSKQAVKVDEDKVVDGTTEEDDSAAGDQLAHGSSQRPSKFKKRTWQDHLGPDINVLVWINWVYILTFRSWGCWREWRCHRVSRWQPGTPWSGWISEKVATSMVREKLVRIYLFSQNAWF